RGNAGSILIVHELDIAAQRYPGDPPACSVAVMEGKDLLAEADREGLDSDAAPARHQEVPHFVNEHDDRQGKQKADHDKQRTPEVELREKFHEHSFLAAMSSITTKLEQAGFYDNCSSTPAANRRASRSIDRISFRQVASTITPARSACSRHISAVRAMSRNPMRPARKASTATSFAALRTAGAVCPRASTSRASRRAGKRISSGASNVNVAMVARSRRFVGADMRAGHVSTGAIAGRTGGSES